MNESLGLFGWTKLNVYGERNGAIYLAKWYLFEHICQTEFFFLFYFETIWWRELKNLGKYFNKLKKKKWNLWKVSNEKSPREYGKYWKKLNKYREKRCQTMFKFPKYLQNILFYWLVQNLRRKFLNAHSKTTFCGIFSKVMQPF